MRAQACGTAALVLSVRSAAGALAAWLALAASVVGAQPYDVPYVPTPQVVVDEMLRAAKVQPGDYVVDLGSGDGRILITAATHFGASGFGVDIDPNRIRDSNENAKAAGVTDRVSFRNANLFETDIGKATVVTMYLLPRVNLKLRPTLLAMKPGTRIVSHDFSMEDWKPDRLITVQKNIFYWVVPADAAGKWKLEVLLPGGGGPFEMEIRQKFQEIDGVARADKRVHPLWEARLEGESIQFTVSYNDMGHRFEGRVRGDTIEGVVRSGVGRAETETPFRATRTGKP